MFPVADDDPWTEIARRQQVRVPDLSRQLPLDFAQVVALCGCVLLIAGVFLPFHRGLSLWDIGLLDGAPLAGMLILVLTQVSLVLTVLRWHVGLWLTSFAVFMTVICSSFGPTRAPAAPVAPGSTPLFGWVHGVLHFQEGAEPEPAPLEPVEAPAVQPLRRAPTCWSTRAPLIDAGEGWALLIFGAFLLACAAALAAWQDYRRAYPFINENEQRSPLARG